MVKDILNEITSLLKAHNVQQKDILSFEEAVQYLNVSKSFLYKMTSSNGLTHHKPSRKFVYFKKTDLDEWMLQNKNESTRVFENEVDSYLNRDGKQRI